MKIIWKAAAAAFAFSALLGAASLSAAAQPYGERAYNQSSDPSGASYDQGERTNDPGPGYGPDQAYRSDDAIPYGYDSGGYCDEYGCPDDYYDMPIYYGPVYYDDLWFDGPVYYRDWYGRQQYWIHGGWHYDQWRGPRPPQYREGRYGPALGRDFYRQHFQGGRAAVSRSNGNRFGSGVRNDGGFVNRASFAPSAHQQAQALPRQQDRGNRFANRGSFQPRARAARPGHGGGEHRFR